MAEEDHLITDADYIRRFEAELLRLSGSKDEADILGIRGYAADTALTYREESMRNDIGDDPEEAARTDYSYWEV